MSKVSVITGAATGLGRALAIKMASLESNIVIVDVNKEGLNETEKLIREQYEVQIVNSLVDVSNFEQVTKLAKDVETVFGRCDYLFNNAGLIRVDKFESLDYSSVFHDQINVNLYGVINGAKAFFNLLKKTEDSHMINISSAAGLVGFPHYTGYNTSKFGVRGFSEAMFAECALYNYGVHIHVVHPSGVQTDIVKNTNATNEIQKKSLKRLEDSLILSAEEASELILNKVHKNKFEILIGKDVKQFYKMKKRLGFQNTIRLLRKMGVLERY